MTTSKIEIRFALAKRSFMPFVNNVAACLFSYLMLVRNCLTTIAILLIVVLKNKRKFSEQVYRKNFDRNLCPTTKLVLGPNYKTGIQFKSCAVIHRDSVVYVSFKFHLNTLSLIMEAYMNSFMSFCTCLPSEGRDFRLAN